jgi:hypothetical protein
MTGWPQARQCWRRRAIRKLRPEKLIVAVPNYFRREVDEIVCAETPRRSRLLGYGTKISPKRRMMRFAICWRGLPAIGRIRVDLAAASGWLIAAGRNLHEEWHHGHNGDRCIDRHNP